MDDDRTPNPDEDMYFEEDTRAEQQREQRREEKRSYLGRFKDRIFGTNDSGRSTLDPEKGEKILDDFLSQIRNRTFKPDNIRLSGLEVWQGQDPDSQYNWKLLVHATPLNSGGMSTVHLGLDLESGQKVALKVPNREAYYRAENQKYTSFSDKTIALTGEPTNEEWVRMYLEANRRELEALRGADSPFVIEAFGSFERVQAKQKETVLVLEYLSPRDYLNGSDATEYYRGKERQAWDDFTSWVPNLVAALLDSAQHAHVVHLDIKPSNIWIPRPEGQAYQAKLADFGVGARKDHPEKTISAGSRPYQAPELFGLSNQELLEHLHQHPESSQVYSLAGTIANILGFGFLLRPELSKKAVDSFCEAANVGIQEDFLDAAHLYRVLNKAIDKDPRERHQTLEEFMKDFLNTSALYSRNS